MSEEINEGQEGEATKRGGVSLTKVLILIIIVVVIALLGYFLMKQGGLGGQAAAVASVNGVNIPRSEYDARYARLEATVMVEGQSTISTEIQTAIKQQVLNDLISESLVLQAAAKSGIKADDAATEVAFNQSKSGFADATVFEVELKKQGFTEASFKETISRNLIIQQYLKANVDVSSATASDAEVKALYNQAAEADETVPPLSEVRAQVENQIISQKQQTLISAFIEKLKAESKIETLI